MRNFLTRIRVLVLLCGFVFLQTEQAYATPAFIAGPDIVIDVGHGGIDGGTVNGNLLEKDINLEMAKMLYAELNRKGYRTVLNRTGDYALSEDNHWLRSSRHRRDLAQRCLIANQLYPKIMISLHVNWSKSRSRTGGVVLHQNNSHSILLANFLQASMNKLYKQSTQPEFGKTFYILNHSVCPTVIVEMGFISNEGDRQQLTVPEKQKQLVDALRSAIDQYFTYTESANSRSSHER
ncbi:N-acetylmuramoyl-L-alanine amidase family protein [Paenibacillus contaminans]|uniref:N-acetylmuramoyl-L-alanine amidase n=1 Tax=Paenibacillus contaminans TaxID=450362 RepID=A0A329MTK1_9BACL|nr:N-acetylmuramoyl-L-alanine amidase [Paenibacillus contaminans]RAV22033.1 N-acetylmuramoyl-L-alanine amidase [Paenibacillus contaminans]